MKLLQIAASLVISATALLMVNSVSAQPVARPGHRDAPPPPVIYAPVPGITLGWQGDRYWDGRRYWSHTEWFRHHSRRAHHAHWQRGPGRLGPHR